MVSLQLVYAGLVLYQPSTLYVLTPGEGTLVLNTTTPQTIKQKSQHRKKVSFKTQTLHTIEFDVITTTPVHVCEQFIHQNAAQKTVQHCKPQCPPHTWVCHLKKHFSNGSKNTFP